MVIQGKGERRVVCREAKAFRRELRREAEARLSLANLIDEALAKNDLHQLNSAVDQAWLLQAKEHCRAR